MLTKTFTNNTEYFRPSRYNQVMAANLTVKNPQNFHPGPAAPYHLKPF